MSHKIVLSTGVLNSAPLSVTAVINLMNLEINNAHRVIVEVWDWSSCATPSPVSLRVGDNEPVMFPLQLEAQSLAVMYADIDESVELYEVRLIHSEEKQVITSVWKKRSREYNLHVFQEGHKVLQQC